MNGGLKICRMQKFLGPREKLACADSACTTNWMVWYKKNWPLAKRTVLEEEVPTELKVLLTLTGTLTSLLKHTTEDPDPGCLSRRRIVKMIYFKL